MCSFLSRGIRSLTLLRLSSSADVHPHPPAVCSLVILFTPFLRMIIHWLSWLFIFYCNLWMFCMWLPGNSLYEGTSWRWDSRFFVRFSEVWSHFPPQCVYCSYCIVILSPSSFWLFFVQTRQPQAYLSKTTQAYHPKCVKASVGLSEAKARFSSDLTEQLFPPSLLFNSS